MKNKALFQRCSKSGSRRTSGYARNVTVKTFVPDHYSTGCDFGITIDWTVDTGHKCGLALYGEDARQFISSVKNL